MSEQSAASNDLLFEMRSHLLRQLRVNLSPPKHPSQNSHTLLASYARLTNCGHANLNRCPA